MCCNMLQCAAVCCSVLQCVAVEPALLCSSRAFPRQVPERSVLCCSVLQLVAVCCSVWQCVAMCWCVLQSNVLDCVAAASFLAKLPRSPFCVAVWCSVLHCVAVCCSVLQCNVVYCSELQRVAVFVLQLKLPYCAAAKLFLAKMPRGLVCV